MEQTLTEQPNSENLEAPQPAPKRSKRAGKRKSGFRMDTPPFPIRAIWELASPEERKKGHEMGILMLEHWLGRMTRKELGQKLELPPLRVWQMSQQALAGMVVGMMAQPKRPPKGTLMASEKKQEKDELKTLRKEYAALKVDNQRLTELLEILRDLPEFPEAVKIASKGKKKEQDSPANPLAQAPRSMAAKNQPAQG
jgi:hypothetical protein